MWRAPSRRALRCCCNAVQRRWIQSQVTILDTQKPSSQSDEPIFRFAHFSSGVLSRSHHYQRPKFFSSNVSEDFKDFRNETIDSGMEDFREGFDLGNEDSIFGEAAGNLGVSRGFGENFDGNMVGIVDATAKDFEVVERVEENDSEKVEGLLSLLQSRGTIAGGSVESMFEEMRIVLNEDFLLKVIETPHVPGDSLMGFAKWAMKELEFKVTARVMESLVGVICMEKSKRNVYALWDFVIEFGGKHNGLISTTCLNALIANFSILGKGKAAFDVFNKFDELGGELNADSYYFTIEALCRRSFFDWAVSVCEKMLNAEKLPNGERVGKIISYLCRGNKGMDAHLLYLYAKDKNITLPKGSLNFLITSLSRIKRTDKGNEQENNKELDRETVSLASKILDDFSVEDRKSAVKPFSSVIKKFCWIEDAGSAKRLLQEMIDVGPPPGNSIFNCVINGLAKGGEMDEALTLLKIMKKRGLKPDVYTYSVIMSGYVRKGAMEEACKVFNEAKIKHSKLSPVTFHTLIRGFCKIGEYVKAVNLIQEMKQYGVNPNHDECNKLIKSLCLKALDWETAEKIQTEMKENGLILNGRTRALISAVKELKEGAELEVPAP